MSNKRIKTNHYYEVDILNNKNKIIFNDNFNEPLDNYLLNILQNYQIVIFGMNFNQNIDYLPDNIEILVLSSEFNKPVLKWPSNLKVLKFDACDYFFNGYCKFNHKLVNLPNIKELMIGTFYNHNIDDLPDSIEKLYFTRSTHFNHPINKLPKNLKYINLGRFTIRSFNNIIPNKELLKNIKFIDIF